MLSIDRLSVALQGRPILKNITLTLKPGSTALLMGPNGSGKSTLAYTLMGYPRYEIEQGLMQFKGQELNDLDSATRAKAGIFVAFQHPLAIPGVTVTTFLAEIYRTHTSVIANTEFNTVMQQAFDLVKLPLSFAQRALNVGFSGGEKKRLELIQMLLIKPSLIILDEIDSGLDSEGMNLINKVLMHIREQKPETIVLIISHNAALQNYIALDAVHILKDGALIASGDQHLVSIIEREGYHGLCP